MSECEVLAELDKSLRFLPVGYVKPILLFLSFSTPSYTVLLGVFVLLQALFQSVVLDLALLDQVVLLDGPHRVVDQSLCVQFLLERLSHLPLIPSLVSCKQSLILLLDLDFNLFADAVLDSFDGLLILKYRTLSLG